MSQAIHSPSMSVVGQPVVRNDALDKVTGRLKFPGDLSMPGQLYAKMLWSEHPHANIHVDTSEAEAMPGVVAVFTGKDVPRNEFGLIFKDQPVFSDAVVRSVGDPVAMVVAETEQIAAQARDLIRVTYEPLPVVTDPREAMKPGTSLIHPHKGTNVLKSYRIRKGDVQRGFAEADVIVEDDYFTPLTEQAFLQPEAGIGYIDDQGPRRPKASAPQKRIGVGLACGWKNVGYSFGFPEQSTCIAELYGEQQLERAVLKIGASEVGQGVTTILAQIAAETLHLPYEAVEIYELDTSLVPGAGSSSASRHAFMSANAVKGACERALQAWNEGQRPAVVTYQYLPPRTTPFDPETGECYPNFSYGYASQIAEVDTYTGEVSLTRVIAAHDMGKTINPQTTEGQVNGGVVMVQGWALIEDFIQQDGYIKTRRCQSTWYLLR